MSINIHITAAKEIASARHGFVEEEEVPQYVVEKLKLLLGDSLKRVILFGSRARGDYNEDSDFDFVIIADFTESSWPKRAIVIGRFIGYFGHSVDYIPVTEWELDNKFLFRRAVKKEGVVLYDRGN